MDYLLILLVIICAYITYKFWRVILRPFYLDHVYAIPGPKRTSWIFGNLLEILKEEPQEPLLRWTDESDSSVIRYYFGSTLRVSVSSPELVKKVLTDEKIFTKNLDDYRILAEVTGYSLINTSDINFHRKQRKLCDPAFKYDNILNFIHIFGEQSNKLISKWDKYIKETNGEALIDISKDLSALTLDIIGIGGFNCDFDSLLNDHPDSLANKYIKLMNTFSMKSVLIPGYSLLPTENIRTRKKMLETINKYVTAIIEQRRKLLNPGNTDLLGLLLQEKESETGATLSDTELNDLTLTFLVAGHETTSMLLNWTLYVFSKYPHIEEKCAEEVQRVIGDGLPTKENIGELKYLSNTLNETLRLYAPVPIIKRNVEKETILGGYRIPKDTHVVISPTVLHRTKKHWEEAEVFNPDRWNNGISHSYWFIPFSEGPRNCIGRKFARVEAMVVLTKILQHGYTFRFSEAHPIVKKNVATLRPHPTLMLYVKQRS